MIQDASSVKKKQFLVAMAAIGGFFILVYAGLLISDPKKPRVQVSTKSRAETELMKNFSTPALQVRDEDKWMQQGTKEIGAVKSQAEQQAQMAKALEARLKALEDRNIESLFPGGNHPVLSNKGEMRTEVVRNLVSKELPPPPPPIGMSLPAGSSPAMGAGTTNPLGGDAANKTMPVDIQEIDLTNPQALIAPDGQKKEGTKAHRVETFVPAGSFAKVVLLGGIDAPTGGQAATNALPVVMRVKSFAHLPNYYKANLKECFITGNAFGDLASERAYIRTSKMSCVLRNGNVLELEVKGHLNGEDGSFGMRGKVVSKQGAMIAKSFFSGLFAGLGNSIAQQSQTLTTTPVGAVTSVDPSKALQAGLSSGATTSLNKIAEFYLQQANQIFPIIEISAERIGEIYLMEGVDFGGIQVADNSADIGLN